MTGTLNKALLIGHLGHDPDLRTMNSGEPVAHLSVATSEGWKNKSNSARRDATEWHRVVVYKKLAELAGQQRVSIGAPQDDAKISHPLQLLEPAVLGDVPNAHNPLL